MTFFSLLKGGRHFSLPLIVSPRDQKTDERSRRPTDESDFIALRANTCSVAIEQTKKDRSEVDARRRHVGCPQNEFPASARPNWQLRQKIYVIPHAASIVARHA
jgi:hypothetical protein